MKRSVFTLVALVSLVAASSAFALGKGTSMLSIGLGQNKANIPNPLGTQFDETSVGAEYWHMFSEDYAFAISGGYGFGSAKQEDSDPLATYSEDKYTLTSYRFRIGGDRMGKVGERFVMYIGPGVEYASAKLKNEWTSTSVPSGSFETQNATTWSINGRIGGIMMLSPTLGISGEINHSFGTASYEEGSQKFTWQPNSTGAFWGLTFKFGGAQ